MSLKMSARYLGLNDPYHDTSFCLYDVDHIAHYETERFSRLKFDRLNPLFAIAEVLGTSARQTIEQVRFLTLIEGDFVSPLFRDLATQAEWRDLPAGEVARQVAETIVHNNEWTDSEHGFARTLLRATPAQIDVLACLIDRCRQGAITVETVGHHVAHAANAFFSSPFEQSTILTLDGGGYDLAADGARIVTYGGAFHGAGASLETRSFVTDLSIGGAWARIARDVFGMHFGEEGTIMAMAAFGDPERFRAALQYPLIWLSDEIIREEKAAAALAWHFGQIKADMKTEQDRFDLAATLQQETEFKVHALVAAQLPADATQLCLAGGTFLNCQITGKLYDWFPQLRSVYLPPAPYDGGLSIGAAQYCAHVTNKEPVWTRVRGVFPFAAGRSYSQFEVLAACRAARACTSPCDFQEIAHRLANGQVGAIFSGAAESGRRALGARSIVADPRRASIKEHINRTIKHRAGFRPFAPMVLREQVTEWFECGADFESPYMAHALRVRPGQAHRIPAVLHADGTARVQTVDARLSPDLHRLLCLWREATGVPILLNTSFNDREPIVETPGDALNCFRATPIEFLYFMDEGFLCGRNADWSRPTS